MARDVCLFLGEGIVKAETHETRAIREAVMYFMVDDVWAMILNL